MYRRLCEQSAAFLPGLAGALTNLGLRVSALHKHDLALLIMQDAIQILRELPADSWQAHGCDLAAALNNLSVELRLIGSNGVDAAAEAAAIYRRLAAADPSTFEARLARTLVNFSIAARESNQLVSARQAGEEAVTIWRRLASQDAAVRPDLARALSR